MIRLAVSVEGNTELEFVKQVLAPHLKRRRLDAMPVSVSPSGNISLDRVGKELSKLLNRFAYVTTLYDFYGFKRKGRRTVGQLETAIVDRVGNNRSRLIPYVQKYEFEAVLFSNIDKIC